MLRHAFPDVFAGDGSDHAGSVCGGSQFVHYAQPDAFGDQAVNGQLVVAAGGTDSERYFLRVLSRLRTQDPVDALALAAADIRVHAAIDSLNCLLLNEHALYAYADRTRIMKCVNGVVRSSSE